MKDVLKAFLEWLKQKDRSYVATLFYVLCAILGFLAIGSMISPFSVNVKFLADIKWNTNLTNDSLLVNIVFVLCIISFALSCIAYIVQKTVGNITLDLHNKVCRETHIILDSVADLFDFCTSFFVLLFMISVFLQIYNTQGAFVSGRGQVIYLYIGYKALSYLYTIFYNKNSKLIDELLTNKS